MVGLGALPGEVFFSIACGTSADGEVVVGVTSSDGGDTAFVWDAEHGMRGLEDILTDEFGIDLTGWQLSVASAVSADGRTVAGYGFNPSRDIEAWMASLPPGVLEVRIDIRPGGPTDPLNPESRGVVPVALLGSDQFAVAEVDAMTLRFGPGEARPVHRRDGHFADVNRDGIVDLVSHYRVRDAGINPGDATGCLRGETRDQRPFEGCDDVRVLPHARRSHWR
jgi:hypothetical protein